MPAFMSFLRVLVGITAFLALSATVQNYLNCFGLKQAYSRNPVQVTFFTSRVMCMFTGLSCAVRAALVYDMTNKTVYFLAMITYLDVFLHYMGEVIIFKTAYMNGINISMISIAVVMLVLMIIGHFYHSELQVPTAADESKKNE